MAFLKKLQLKSRSAPRAVAAIVLLAASFLLPPCTMAQPDVDDDYHCPHCPPADTDHQMPGDAAIEPACDALEQLNSDARSPDSSLKDSPVAIVPWSEHPPAGLTHQWRSGALRQTHHPGSPPLNLLHCVNRN